MHDVQACGEEAPTPLSERSYSGTFVVRTSPELHGRLALEAAEQRVSMNQWVVQKFADRQLSSGFGSFGFDWVVGRSAGEVARLEHTVNPNCATRDLILVLPVGNGLVRSVIHIVD